MSKFVFVKSFRINTLTKFCFIVINKMFNEAPVKFKDEWKAINEKFNVNRRENCIGWEFDLKEEVVNSMLSDAVILDKNNMFIVKLINQFLKNLKNERLKKGKDFELELMKVEVEL